MAIFVRVKEDWKNREAVKDRKLKFYKEFYQSMKDFMSQAETKRVYYDSDN
jgi:quinol monooxygenase YgiN